MIVHVPVLYRSPDEVAEAYEIQRSRCSTRPLESRIDVIIRRETDAGAYTAEELRGLARLSVGGP